MTRLTCWQQSADPPYKPPAALLRSTPGKYSFPQQIKLGSLQEMSMQIIMSMQLALSGHQHGHGCQHGDSQPESRRKESPKTSPANPIARMGHTQIRDQKVISGRRLDATSGCGSPKKGARF